MRFKLSKKVKITILIVFLLSLALLFYFRFFLKKEFIKIKNDIITKTSSEIMLDVPFIAQVSYNETEIKDLGCEETAILMLKNFLSNERMDKGQVKKEIDNMITYQIKVYGKQPEMDAEKMGLLVRDVYKLEYEVIHNANIDTIKNKINQGNPVIIPVIAEKLENPYYPHYTGYHTIVVLGFDKENFIVNDPGTGMGSHYRYSFDIMKSAIYNFDKSDKDVLILKRRVK